MGSVCSPLVRAKLKLHIEFLVLPLLYTGVWLIWRANANFVPFFMAWFVYVENFSFRSNITPRYFTSIVGLIVMCPRWIVALWVVSLFLVKCTSMYLLGSNCAPCHCLHVSLVSNIRSRASTFSSVTTRRLSFVLFCLYFFLNNNFTASHWSYVGQGIVGLSPKKAVRDMLSSGTGWT